MTSVGRQASLGATLLELQASPDESPSLRAGGYAAQSVHTSLARLGSCDSSVRWHERWWLASWARVGAWDGVAPPFSRTSAAAASLARARLSGDALLLEGLVVGVATGLAGAGLVVPDACACAASTHTVMLLLLLSTSNPSRFFVHIFVMLGVRGDCLDGIEPGLTGLSVFEEGGSGSGSGLTRPMIFGVCA